MREAKKMKFQEALFNEGLRKETVTLRNGACVVIKQISQGSADRMQAALTSAKSNGAATSAIVLNGRCENEDGSQLIDDASVATMASNVASDSPILIELMERIQKFDESTAAAHAVALKK
jgi:hypothetical protein